MEASNFPFPITYFNIISLFFFWFNSLIKDVLFSPLHLLRIMLISDKALAPTNSYLGSYK